MARMKYNFNKETNCFGTGGEGFLRMNIATPRKLVKEALRRMGEAVNSLE